MSKIDGRLLSNLAVQIPIVRMPQRAVDEGLHLPCDPGPTLLPKTLQFPLGGAQNRNQVADQIKRQKDGLPVPQIYKEKGR